MPKMCARAVGKTHSLRDVKAAEPKSQVADADMAESDRLKKRKVSNDPPNNTYEFTTFERKH